MQHFSLYTGSNMYTPPSERAVAGSKSLATMLPTILMTGVITLVATAVMRLVWAGFNNEFFGAWMEAWLTSWPIAFPVAYLAAPLIRKLSRRLNTVTVVGYDGVDNAVDKAGDKSVANSYAARNNSAESAGLSFADITSASIQASAKNNLRVRRSVATY